jgi:enterochelin esterase-like enzyme
VKYGCAISRRMKATGFRRIEIWLSFVFLGLLSACTSQNVSAGSNVPVTATPTPVILETSIPQEPTSPVVKNTFTPTPTLAPVCNDTKGIINNIEIPNTALSYPLKVKVYLPPCYSDHPKSPYPYVVMIHGMLLKYDQWDRLGADNAADELISSGEAPPFLILMPYEEQSTANPFEDGFGDAITGGLIPYVEENYPVCKERSCRAIGGLSRGAGWAVHIGLSKPQFFSSIGAHSLPPFIGDLAAAPRWLADIPQDELPRVYIDIGIADSGMSPASQFEQILTAYNVPHEWYINNGEHTEEYWSSHVKEYMRWYVKGWKPEETPVVLP